MNKTIPALEYFCQYKDSLDNKHLELVPKALKHFKTYRTDKQDLQKECMEIDLEKCCEKIHVLKTNFTTKSRSSKNINTFSLKGT